MNNSNNENDGFVDNPAEEFLLTTADVNLIQTPQTLERLPEVIEAKIERTKEIFQRPYIIDHTLYTDVYITSDIHADLEKFDSMLMNSGIIRRTPWNAGLGITPEAHMICNTEWGVYETIVIIIGDIVDGRRGDDALEIPDAKGDIELLLHMYLYNLRIKANSFSSELRFTIGNHDFHTVIEENTQYPLMYDNYVHRRAKAFFVGRAQRRNCLKPFYQCCAYLLLSLSDEIACVHGGFVGYVGGAFQDNTAFITAAQIRIDGSPGKFDALTGAQLNALGTSNNGIIFAGGYEVSPLWSRWYAYSDEAGVCSHINRPENLYKLTVVGHCQTGNSLFRSCCADAVGGHGQAILSRVEYTRHNCDNGGCVMVGCMDPEGIPRLAFVDIAMSRAFDPALTLQVRAELLHLRNNNELDQTQRFYNVIERLNAGMRVAGGVGEPSEVVWVAPQVVFPVDPLDPMAGGRTRRRRNRKSRRHLKPRRRKTKVVRRRTKRRA
jgi:hypothetical protein